MNTDTMTEREKALDALDRMSASRAADYESWLAVGMALHSAGCAVQDWASWHPDGSKNHDKICQAKWDGFGKSGGKQVGIATIIKWAKEDSPRCTGRVLGWEDEIGPMPKVETRYTEPQETPEHEPSHKQLERYIAALFKPEEHVGFNLNAVKNDDGKWIPCGKGVTALTAGKILDNLAQYGNISESLGDWEADAGAWIRINPFDNSGEVRDANVTNMRHCLVECDGVDKETQLRLYKKLELPCAAIVDSGGKSIHAIVKVQAADQREYRDRANYIYALLEKNGIKVDQQNRNPSRLSRLPGVSRNGKIQTLIAVNAGQPDYKAWLERMEEIAAENDGLPQFDMMSEIIKDMPDMAPELVHGLLRKGHKMLISGPSKAGKSFALIQFALAVANGKPWLGFQCEQGRALYVNLEIDRASMFHRMKKVADTLGQTVDNIDIWNMRGHHHTLGNLIPKLLRRMKGIGYAAVIIDPIYKLLEGDENSNADMARFCSHLDKVCVEQQTAVLVCSHFSKGHQGHKASIDRTAGAGVFGRDPDAIITMSELDEPCAYRVEFTLREFKSPPPTGCWFKFPVHAIDTTGELDKAKVPGEAGRPKKEFDLRSTLESLESFHGRPPTLKEVADSTKVSKKTIERRAKEAGITITKGSFQSVLNDDKKTTIPDEEEEDVRWDQK